MTTPVTVPCASRVALAVAGPLTHRCPHVDEVDNGSVELTWRTNGGTLELHSVRAWLDTFADLEITHEDLTEELRATLAALPKISDIQVATRWNTAGFAVTVREVR